MTIKTFTGLLAGTALVLGASAFVPMGTDAGAFAQGKSEERGNGGGNRGGGNGGRSDDDRGNRGNGNGNRTASADEDGPLRPNQLGRLNASNANQAAIDAHIRNGNFNGTVGALAQYQLASRYAAGEELSEIEQQRVDELLAANGIETSDGTDVTVDIDASLTAANEISTESGMDAVYGVDGATVTCTGADCSDTTIAALQSEVDAQVGDVVVTDGTGDLLAASEERILDAAPDRNLGDRILDTVAGALGIDRTAAVEPEPTVPEGEVIDGVFVPAD
ncbi:hypothetical protein [Roseobacter sp. HKCCA0434]|uniref:hypothetical protein n=1 Tax=Roseobacter sp. HKCCA0434 TaxID=3079297 RepID=UPI002905C1FE|nr:hypothetical protein [Roseobacter sp. HKCCA0434]